MTELLDLADISGLRRMAFGALTLLDGIPADNPELYRDSLEQAKKLVKVLSRLVKNMDKYKHIVLLEGPWDKIFMEIAEKWFISKSNIKKLKLLTSEMVDYLNKLIEGEKLSPYEKDKLRNFLTILVDVPLAEESKLLNTFTKW